ncbi:hypothetical protein HYPSUDRAFT_67450 [Hypholoma sublateritium FD-334 SS-4]|uniref:Uncharacterized protein n=1 Tax=Hypholoma sublateritium (strain FD-334 SS-4) TaxID=945553 RepID=A0A0D2L4L6_HYPSF|nr:hypothetical protein HYPSUDRAFT_67450 [Hypholoma sublateritium FD-334 SS-4]
MSSGPTPSAPASEVPGEALAGYPTQRHAGKVGYGPNYNTSASVFDKVEGLAEEVAGKVTRNPKLVSEGHEKHTGESKKKKLLGEEEDDSPFESKSKIPAKDTNLKSMPGQHPETKASGIGIHVQPPAAAASHGLKESGPALPPSYGASREI